MATCRVPYEPPEWITPSHEEIPFPVAQRRRLTQRRKQRSRPAKVTTTKGVSDTEKVSKPKISQELVDRAIVASIAQCYNDQAITKLLERLIPKGVRATVISMLGKKYRDHLKDVLQEVRLDIVRGLATFRAESLIETWAYTITRNTTNTFLNVESKQAGNVSETTDTNTEVAEDVQELLYGETADATNTEVVEDVQEFYGETADTTYTEVAEDAQEFYGRGETIDRGSDDHPTTFQDHFQAIVTDELQTQDLETPNPEEKLLIEEAKCLLTEMECELVNLKKEGVSADEIASRLGFPSPGAVDVAYHRARKKIEAYVRR